RPEGRLLDRRIDETRRVAAGEDMLSAIGIERDDCHRDMVEDAAGGALRGDVAGDDIDLRGALVTLGEGRYVVRWLLIPEIVPGAGVFLAVHCVVERFYDRSRTGAVVDVARLLCESLDA